MPNLEQRISTMISNLEAALKHKKPDAPDFMLYLQVKELASIVQAVIQEKPDDGE